MSQLKEFRKQKDAFMQSDAHSPLTEEQKAKFNGLKYFGENKDLRFHLEIDAFDDQEEIMMQTSTGSVQNYKRFGRFAFEVDGEKAELTLFASDHGFFLPFVDSQAGKITYGAGRYLDPEQNPDGSFDIDFNDAYNPYCAYNERWSCPLPPGENRLEVPIRAGEKNFKEE